MNSKSFCLILFLLCNLKYGKAQCPALSLDKTSATITLSNFAEFLSDPIVFSATYVNVDASLNCTWDLYAVTEQFNSVSYTTQGSFDASFIDIRLVNVCETSSEDFNGDLVSDCTTDATRICNSFGNSPLVVGTQNYIVGTNGPDGAINASIGPCAGAAPEINDEGSPNTDPNTHRFRVDFTLDFSGFPAAILTPGTYALIMKFVTEDEAFGFTDEEFFTLNIEIPSILTLNAKNNTELDFSFSDLKSYAAGINRYGSTILEVSSNVNWDLIGYATSSRNEAAPGNPYWDVLASYGTGGSTDIPLNALELHQTPANPTGTGDYSSAFSSTPALSGPNTIEVARGTGTPLAEFPGTLAKTIAGDWGVTTAGGGGLSASMTPGSYKIPSADWDMTDFRYVMSYRILPSLPATFPNGADAAGVNMTTYARSGVYTMFIKYLLTEDQ
jgi:hypothetical protein